MASSGRRRRVFSPNEEKKKEPLRNEREAERSQLVSQIQASYTQALLLLPAFNAGGLCFGLLDPVSNIVVNALSSPPPADSQLAVSEKLRQEEAAGRSAEALLTFLTYFFPYLPEWEAVRYLLVAHADLVVAVRLIIRDRCLVDYCFADSFKMALKCAALAADHDRLVATWSDPSTSSLRELRSKITSMEDDDGARRLARLRTKLSSSMPPVAGSTSRIISWEELAADREHDGDMDHKEEVASMMSLRRALLDKIHGYCLRALARLPVEYHRSMLHAGHCYGPMDPVSNIVLNTVSCHHFPFPAAKPMAMEQEDDSAAASAMPRLLLRVGARSLYGLASFLDTRYPGLDFHAALRCLLSAGAHLQGACKHAERQLLGPRPHPHLNGVLLEAYAAAAIAARHPQPDAQACRLTSLSLQLSSSSASMEMIFKLLPTNNSVAAADSRTLPMRMHSRGSPSSSSESRIHTKVKAALSKYYANMRITADPDIHAICGVNDRVMGPDTILYRCSGHPYYNTHVNFLVGTHCSNKQQPMLFFAELSNEDDDNDMVAAACPVTPGQLLPRCLYCNYKGSRIAHPRVHEFHGRDLEFQRMVCHQDLLVPQHQSYTYTNSSIIQRSDYIAERLQDIRNDSWSYIRAI
ncbi:uncharacterized protein LOC112268958 [Brachypodium distachyon]|uniref:Uncharacterized protein n=1 Tax=Brachypodium distachyon TaxID=15368 RepID=I1IVB3_BRADI|nr:uncharacterized protein LOC112268958 [Brachypodium distachyon]PNT65628.1 hypothetical protein BRADI_4g45280v3 [Brachypodium distachyon]|eukprot:XP_024311122.1 uncharacterized protein LOC112268958 [Brachypodium distachyon]